MYKKIPQFTLLNSEMTIEEFKIIFYWEYFHRVLARIIGLFFLLPFLYFYLSKKINNKYLTICSIIFLLILLQGLVGWYMVQSGLVNDVTVSHYRLSIHLILAFFIISSIFWLLKNFSRNKNVIFFNFKKKNLPFQVLILLIFMQIILGAFVSGLDAGKIYQTWPLMGDSYLPNDLILNSYDQISNFNNHSLVQFYHRNLAYFIIFYVLVLSIYIYINRIRSLFNSLKQVVIVLIFQIMLGILTLTSGLNIYLASAHQISSVLLVFSAINLYYCRTK